jgi:hypothetical protein
MSDHQEKRLGRKYATLRKEFERISVYGQIGINELLILEVAKLSIAIEDLEERVKRADRIG